MRTHPGTWIGPLLVGSLLLPAPLRAGGQVPIHGVTGTMALPANVDRFYSGMNKILVSTGDAIHVVHKTRSTKDKGSAASLDGLQPGTPVVVQYAVRGIATSADVTSNESTVTSVDRDRKRITIASRDGDTETLRVAKRGPFSEDHPRSRVVVYHTDASGRRVANYFKPVAR
jgi:hypothetical protein